MGPGGIGAAVTGAGPLIHLAEIGALRLLRVFDQIHIPAAVWGETVEAARVSAADLAPLSIQRHTLQLSEVQPFVQARRLESLHAGEAECLFLCQQIRVSILLTDDLLVRNACRKSAVTPVGSLGGVVKAYQRGQIPR